LLIANGADAEVSIKIPKMIKTTIKPIKA